MDNRTKCCQRCRQVKPLSEFRKHRDRPDGLDGWCRTCKIEYLRQWRKDNSEKQARGDRRVNLRRYGLTPDDYERMRQEQGGRCGICGTDKPGGRGSRGYWHVDHNPKNGNVRGLLCFWCNTRIGILEKFRTKGIWERALAWIDSDVDHRPTRTLF